uniref:TauD/TfdA-like domain-containing protein n=1 Tax=Ananas comosus var. bracteatus TaxID=296719 RepID=A0A6V7QJA7_ANACO|nr:unnamed protein product [Ananas comosus var. bracteatus]
MPSGSSWSRRSPAKGRRRGPVPGRAHPGRTGRRPRPVRGPVGAEKARLESLLRSSGAILLRGFPVRSAVDFDRAVGAFGYAELPYVGGAAPRTNVVGRVFTANDAPRTRRSPSTTRWPMFWSSHPSYSSSARRSPKVVVRHPSVCGETGAAGLIYTRVLGEGDDPSSPIGCGWQSTFLTNDKAVAEQRAARQGMKLEWLDDGVKTIMGPIPAVKFDESRGRKIWFNSIVAAFTPGWQDTRNDPLKAVTFGDGSLLLSDDDIIDECLKILEEECVAVPWKQATYF